MVVLLLLLVCAINPFSMLVAGLVTPEEAKTKLVYNRDIDDLIDSIKYNTSNFADYIEEEQEQRTLLMIAAQYSRGRVVTALLNAGADVDAVDTQGRTALTLAIDNDADSVEVVNLLLNASADVNLPRQKFWSPLHYAAFEGSASIVESILDKDANVNREDINGKTPLIIAAERSSSEVLQLLINAGADVDHVDHEGNTALLKLISSLRSYSIDTKNDMFDVLIEGKANPNLPAPPLWGPLQIASDKGASYIMEALVEAGADVNRVDPNGKTPLMLAAEGHHSVLGILIEERANVDKQDYNGDTAMTLNIKNHRYYNREIIISNHEILMATQANVELPTYPAWGPIHYAAEEGLRNITKSLISGNVNVNREDFSGKTPLLIAAENSDDVIEDLLAAGSNVEHMALDGDNALMKVIKSYSAHNRKESLIKLIASNASVNVLESTARSPLHEAVEYARIELVDDLIEAGADVNKRDVLGRTPLMIAAMNGRPVLQQLIDAGADVDSQAYDGNTALTFSIKNWPSYYNVERQINLDVLLNASARTDLRGEPFEGPLHLAAKESNKYITNSLIEHNAEIDREDSSGKTPLFVAIENQHGDVVDALLQAGADPNHINYRGNSPIQTACISNYYWDGTDILEKLLAAGGDPNFQLSTDSTALMSAVSRGSEEHSKVLLENGASTFAIDYRGYSAHFFVDHYNNRYVSILKALISHGTDMNQESFQDGTVLHMLIKRRNSALFALAMKVCPDLSITDGEGRTVWETAEYYGSTYTNILQGEHQSYCVHDKQIYEEGSYMCWGERVLQCNSSCQWDEVNITLANCSTGECNFTCSTNWDPICGSNGVTYENECHFRKAACNNPSITLARRGYCVPIVSCVVRDQANGQHLTGDSTLEMLSDHIITRFIDKEGSQDRIVKV